MNEFKRISSKDNEIIKRVSKLQKEPSFRKKEGEFVAEGLRICSDCVDNGITFETLILSESFFEKEMKIEGIINNSKEKIVIKDYLFEKISDTKNPQGIIGVGKIPNVFSKELKRKGRYIALENIADPANLGAISRTAEALGVDGIILSSDSCDPYSPKSLRASMGTLLRMPIFIFDNFCNDIKESGLEVFACVVSGGEDIKQQKFCDGSIVMIGNEANGLTEHAKSIGKNITINMQGKAESLNAAVAAAIAMWELKK